ncbi:hypothetical protein N8881_06790 [Pseudomonadales bacterium]|nr:hypothetical protein [Pseudomonadales bacterium]
MLDKLKGWELTSEDEAKAEEGFWLVPGVFYHNHATVVCAPSNGGKTRITFYLMCQLAKKGFDIHYINMDIALNDAVIMRQRAIEARMNFLTPDLRKTSASEVYNSLAAIAQSDDDLSNVVFVIDNLKQIADVINKREIKEKMMTLCSTLTRTGATIVILAHTNKYPDKKGKPIYEGTNDVENYTSDMIYLESDKTTNGQTVQLVRGKKRLKDVTPPSFQIDRDGNVTELESPVDVRQLKKDRGQQAKDKDGVDAARERLKLSECIQRELVEYVSKEAGMGKITATKLLKRYIGQPTYWKVEKGDNNGKVYKKWLEPDPL